MSDYLAEMLDMQDALNSKIAFNRETIKKMDENTLCMWHEHCNSAQICESGEFWEAANGRWWREKKKNWKETAVEEFIDELHFVFCKALLLGLSSKDIFEAYKKKNEKNFHRESDNWKYTEVNSNA